MLTRLQAKDKLLGQKHVDLNQFQDTEETKLDCPALRAQKPVCKAMKG